MSNLTNINSALASASESPRAHGAGEGSGRAFTIVLMVVFFAVMMVCLVAGASIYRSVEGIRTEANNLHMESGLLVNIVRMNDSADAVQVAQGPEGDALVLVEQLESGTYETRVYAYDGSIVQEYAIAGRPFNPDNAVPIVESSTFEFSYDDGLLTLETDDGTFSAALRSSQDAEGVQP